MSSMPPPPPPPPPPPGYSPYPASAGGSSIGEVAGFGPRLGGYLLDSLLYGLLGAVFAVPAIVLGVAAFKDCDRFTDFDGTRRLECTGDQLKVGLLGAAIGIGVLGAIVVAVIYIRALARTGQTWGRRIVGIKVVDKQSGEPIGVGKAIGRTILEGLISRPICMLGYLWMLWDKDQQTWHDKIVGSQVVKA